MDLVRVDPCFAQRVISMVKEFLDDALVYSNDEVTYAGLKDRIIAGEFDLWVLIDRTDGSVHGAIVTGLVDFETKRVMDVIAMAAKTDDRSIWLEHLQTIDDYARGMGCSEIVIEGRKGWSRVLDKVGFELVQVKMVKRLIE